MTTDPTRSGGYPAADGTVADVPPAPRGPAPGAAPATDPTTEPPAGDRREHVVANAIAWELYGVDGRPTSPAGDTLAIRVTDAERDTAYRAARRVLTHLAELDATEQPAACRNCAGIGTADHPLVPTTICEDCKGTGVAEPAPATPGEALRKRLADAKRHLFAHIIASAHLLDKPFTNAPDQSPWSRMKHAMEGLDAAITALDAAHATDPAPATKAGEALELRWDATRAPDLDGLSDALADVGVRLDWAFVYGPEGGRDEFVLRLTAVPAAAAAPGVYQLPAEPPAEVAELWDAHGCGWQRDAEPDHWVLVDNPHLHHRRRVARQHLPLRRGVALLDGPRPDHPASRDGDAVTALNPELEAGLLRYLAVRDQARADQVTERLAQFTDWDRGLVREAAVMGYVLGHMAGEVAGRRGDPPDQRRIPPDSRIVAEVLLGCAAQSDLYPLIGEHVEDDDDTE